MLVGSREGADRLGSREDGAAPGMSGEAGEQMEEG